MPDSHNSFWDVETPANPRLEYFQSFIISFPNQTNKINKYPYYYDSNI